jgi:hypothetical protein
MRTYIHLLLLSTFVLYPLYNILGQCNNSTSYGSGTAPAAGGTVSITTCQFAGEYFTLNSVVAGQTYTVGSSVSTDYVTVRQGTSGGTLIAHGTQPLTFTATVSGTYYVHINTNASCGTQSSCRTTTVSNVTSGGGCNNTTAYGSATAPVNTTITITTCQYAGEYATLNSVVAGATYTSSTNLAGGYFTIRQGTPGGPVIAAGNAPLTWTATVAGTYYIHLNTNSSCGTNSTCQTNVISNLSCTPPTAPTSVTATPSTICPGQSVNLNATSAGNTIRWYTVATGGTSIGSSSSGANFSVSPLTTTTYYAESFDGTCPSSTRSAVTVNVSAAPSAPSNATATPALICSGGTSQLNALASSTGFTGAYGPANWTFSNGLGDNGSGSTAGAPTSISMTSSNNGSFNASSCFYTINITTSGTLTFNWSYTTTEFSAAWDYPQYAINGVIIALIPGFSGAGGTTQSGTASISVTAGQTFSFVMTSGDNSGGSATTVFSSFSGPASGSNSIRWYSVATGGTPLGTVASGTNFAVNPTATTTYYAETYTSGGCASTVRTPVTVDVEVPTVPNPVTATPSTICAGQGTNLNAISGSGSAIISGFNGGYAPANWTISYTPSPNGGTVNTSGAPANISLTSSDAGIGSNQSVIYTVTVISSGNITFNWNYVTTDVGGSSYDVPEYYINGVNMGFFPGFVSGGPNTQSGTATIAVTAGQTFSFAIRATDDILGAATVTISNFTAPGFAGNPIHWFTTATGGTSIGTSLSGDNFPVTPGSTITYYAQAVTAGLGCVSTSRTPVTVTVNTFSTTPVLGTLQPSYCPNTNITLTAGGGTAGSGSDIYWYTGPNGTGTLVGTGSSVVVAPLVNTTYYIRRQGTCNTTTDEIGTVVLKNYIYALNGTSTSNYCTDNAGWHHFYVGDDIILSVMGNLSAAGTVTATIMDNGAYYLDPGNTATCTGEVQFEMERNWNIDVSGTLSGTYDARYYFMPAERNAVITAANNWIANYAACGYTYKYPNPDGWFWFKNQGSAYSAPDYDDDPTFYLLTNGGSGTTPNGINYATMSGIPNFSGGTGGVILIPTVILPVEWLYFNGVNEGSINKLFWATATEEDTDKFEIQRSIDGVNFEKIGTVKATGSSNEAVQYHFDDLNPITGLNYYRIRLINLDGTEDFTNIIALELLKKEQNFSFFPNPAEDLLNYQFETNLVEDVNIEIIDVLGRTLISKTFKTSTGNNILPIQLGDLLPGAYTIKVMHSNGVSNSTKFIKK